MYSYATCTVENAEGDPSVEDILAVSCHMPKSCLTIEQRLAEAKQFFEKLNKTQLSLSCPVIVGGDFNCIISHKSVETNFEIPLYEATERHKIRDIAECDVKCLFETLSNEYSDKYSILVAGDFNIYNIIDPGFGDIKYYE